MDISLEISKNWVEFSLGVETRTMNRVVFLAALCVFLGGCDGTDRSLISSPVTLGSDSLVLVPDRPLQTPEHFNELCIAFPPEYHVDSLTLRSDSGGEVRVRADLIDTKGESHSFSHQSFLFGKRRYVCVSSDSPDEPGVRYRKISISSSAPLRTEEIRWISTDKL
jgi:hypothetical protein